MPDNTDRKKDVAQWMTRINKAQNKRRDFEQEWIENYKQVYGLDWMKDGKRDRPVVSSKQLYDFDLLLSYLKTELPSLVLHKPEVFLNARGGTEVKNPQSQKEAKLLESHVNIILADIDGLETEIRCVLADAHCAYGIMKVLPVFNSKPHPMAGQEVTDTQGMPLVDPETLQPLIYPDEVLGEPQYDMSRVDAFKFLIDDRTKNNPCKAAWKGEEIDRTLEEIKYSGIYDPDMVAKLEAKVKDKHNIPDWEIELKLYEIYDRYNDKIIVICEEYQDDFLRFDDMPSGIEKDPYVILKLTEIPGQWFPKAEMTSGSVHQKDYRQGREWQRDWARKTKPQLGLKASFAEGLPDEARKVGDGISDTVRVNSESDIFLLNKDTLKANVSLDSHMALCLKDFDQTMGQSSQSRGLTGEAKFATEAEIAELSGNIREQDKLQLVKTFFSKAVEKLLFLIKDNPAEPDEIRNIALNLDLDIEIDVESKSPKNRAIERKQLNEAIVTILSNPAIMQCPTLLDQIFRDFEIREKDKIIEELQAALQAMTPKPQKPGINVSLALKQELLPPIAIDKIVDMVMNADIPVYAGNAGNGQSNMAPNESVAEGTEGMSPGSGLMPSGGNI